MIELLLASPLSGLPPSQAVLRAYEMACNAGELHLDAGDAEIISPDTGATPYPFYHWGTPTRMTTIGLANPRGTVIRIATYNPKYPQQMAKVCVVYSQKLSREDAIRGFLAATQGNGIWRDLDPAKGNTPLVIDRPKEGYQKRLQFLDDGWVMLETGLYKEPH